MMHITLFITSLDTGGTPRQLLALASGLRARGVAVSIVTVYPGGAFWRQAQARGLECEALFPARPGARILRVLCAIRAPARLRRQARESGTSVVYSFLDWPNLIARLATAGAARQVLLVWGCRASEVQPGLRAHFAHRVCRFLAPGVDLVIANSNAGLELLQRSGFRVARGEVVYNGFDTQFFQFDPDRRAALRREWDISEDQLLVVLVGRRDARKGHDQFVLAARQLHAMSERFRFACVGPGTAGSLVRLERAIASCGMSDVISVVEEAEDIVAVYSAADVVVSASTSEGFANVIGEAMSCSRTCVVTDVGDVAALVADCGIIVAPEDADALARGIDEATRLAPEWGDRARARIAGHFSIDKLAGETLRLLDDH